MLVAFLFVFGLSIWCCFTRYLILELDNIDIKLKGLKTKIENQKEIIISLKNEVDIKTVAYKLNVLKSSSVSAFSKTELKDLRSLVHPDKHSNSESANRMFKLVNSLYKDY